MEHRLIQEGSRKLNDGCLERHYNKGTNEETVNYHCDVLEAKIVFGESLIVSIASEFIENNGEDAQSKRKMSEEKRKQDCETKAFKRLAGDTTHACSHDATAMKNHYLMTQISDMVKQLYEWFCLKARGIKKKQKIYLPNC